MHWTSVVAADPHGGVEAGTLLGAGSHGEEPLAGEGAMAIARPGGRLELRAARDGVVVRDPVGVAVRRAHEMIGDVDASVADRAVRGSLRVGGRIAPGHALSATGPMRVEGQIDRSEVRAGGELDIEGAASGSVLIGGAHAELRSRLHVPLRGMAQEIDELVEATGQLLRADPHGALVTQARAIRMLCGGRHETLGERVEQARAVLAASQRRWPGLCAGLSAELEAVHRALTAPERLDDPLAALAAGAGFLAAAVPARAPLAGVGIRMRSARSCAIETAGSLRLTGSGATGCDIEVGGDLFALGAGGVIAGGEAHVGGRVRVRELAAAGGRALRVVLDDARPSEDLLMAGLVGAGVEVEVGGRVVRFERRRTDVRIGVSGGRPVVGAV